MDYSHIPEDLRDWLLRLEADGAEPLDHIATIPVGHPMYVKDLRVVVTRMFGQAPPTPREIRANQALFARP